MYYSLQASTTSKYTCEFDATESVLYLSEVGKGTIILPNSSVHMLMTKQHLIEQKLILARERKDKSLVSLSGSITLHTPPLLDGTARVRLVQHNPGIWSGFRAITITEVVWLSLCNHIKYIWESFI